MLDGPGRELLRPSRHMGYWKRAMIIVSASTLLCIAINLGKLTLLSIAMAGSVLNLLFRF